MATVDLRCEGGQVITHDLPLSPPVKKRLDKGDIEIVQPEPEPEPKATRKTTKSE